MIPRAIEVRTQRVADQTKAVLAAIGAAFSKEALEQFNDQIRFLESLLLTHAYEARGYEAPKTGVLPPNLAKMTRELDGMGRAESEASSKPDARVTKKSTRRHDA